MPSNHLILYHSLLLLPSIFPSIRVFSSESAPLIRWPKYWSFSYSISPFNELQHPLSSVQLLSHVWLFVNPWITAHQASLSITKSRSSPKLMFIESVIPSNHLILYHPLLLLPSIFPRIRVFSNESVLRIRCQSIGVSASASVLPMNIQDWFPLGWTGWTSLQSKGLSSWESSPTPQLKSINSSVLNFFYSPTLHTWLLEKPYLWLDGPLLAK